MLDFHRINWLDVERFQKMSSAEDESWSKSSDEDGKTKCVTPIVQAFYLTFEIWLESCRYVEMPNELLAIVGEYVTGPILGPFTYSTTVTTTSIDFDARTWVILSNNEFKHSDDCVDDVKCCIPAKLKPIGVISDRLDSIPDECLRCYFVRMYDDQWCFNQDRFYYAESNIGEDRIFSKYLDVDEYMDNIRCSPIRLNGRVEKMCTHDNILAVCWRIGDQRRIVIYLDEKPLDAQPLDKKSQLEFKIFLPVTCMAIYDGVLYVLHTNPLVLNAYALVNRNNNNNPVPLQPIPIPSEIKASFRASFPEPTPPNDERLQAEFFQMIIDDKSICILHLARNLLTMHVSFVRIGTPSCLI